MKVSAIWRGFTILLIGILLGGILTIRHLVPPATQINLGSVKIKGGKGETSVRDLLGIQVENQVNKPRIREAKPQDPLLSPIPDPVEEQLTRKEIRQERRSSRREVRQSKKEGG